MKNVDSTVFDHQQQHHIFPLEHVLFVAGDFAQLTRVTCHLRNDEKWIFNLHIIPSH